MPLAQQGFVITDSAQITAGTILNTDIADDQITDAKVNSAAAIAYSKLALTGAVVNNDLAGSIADSKLSQITTAGKVSGAALTLLANIPAGAGVIPVANLPVLGGFGFLDFVTLGSANATLATNTFTAKEHLLVIIGSNLTAAENTRLQFNGDSGANYAFRLSTNGGADSTSVSNSYIDLNNISSGNDEFTVLLIQNYAAQGKLVDIKSIESGAAASTAPQRAEGAGYWHNTAAQITSLAIIQGGATTFAAGTYISVYGRNDND